MNIKELLNKPAYEMTESEFKAVFDFKRSMHAKLLNIVEGDTLREKNAKIEELSFEERIDLVLGVKE